jgi:hypothetical protein
MNTSLETLIPLRDGPAVPASVVVWMTNAEERGVRFRLDSDGRIHVGPRDRVQGDDLAFIRQHRADVVACVAYIENLAVSPW